MYRLALIAVLLRSLFCLGQQAPDPTAILQQAKQRLLNDVARMPRYTCAQTINRQYFASPFHWGSPNGCQEVIAEHDKRTHELKLKRWDRLRLDVAIAGGEEIYSWVGASRLGTTNLEQIAGTGSLGSGDFGPFLSAILIKATITFKQETVLNGRHLLEYSYDVPRSASRYEVFYANGKGSVFTAYSGKLGIGDFKRDKAFPVRVWSR